MRNILKLNEEEVRFFHNLDSKKGFLVAKFFLEWINKKRLTNFKTKPRIDYYEQFIDETSYLNDSGNGLSFVDDYVLRDESFYQKVKDKELKDALKIFEHEMLLITEEKPVMQCSNGFKWYDSGDFCDIGAHYLKNCGNIGELMEYNFSLFLLKNQKRIPVAMATVGNARNLEKDQEQNLVVNFAGKLNQLPEDPILWNCLKELCLHMDASISFTILDEDGNDFSQTPGFLKMKDRYGNGNK
jgi:hypothetical protein